MPSGSNEVVPLGVYNSPEFASRVLQDLINILSDWTRTHGCIVLTDSNYGNNIQEDQEV